MKSSGIGGQAVIEGVMMKNKNRYAVAVRKPDNEIEVMVKETDMLSDKYKILKVPVIRGVYNFIASLATGMSTLTYSAGFYSEEDESDHTDKKSVEEKSAEKKSAKEKNGKENDKQDKLIMAGTVALSVVLAVLVFMIAPYCVSRLFSLFLKNETAIILIEGLVRLVFFIIYVKMISLMNDIKRVFMYHGAEHKCINCVEHGMELTVENVMASSKEHKRCGTSFLLLVMCISMVFFMFIRVSSPFLRLLFRLLLIPVIAGVSYEVLRYAGNTDSKFMDIVSRPGLMLQRLTTKEPDEAMVEVAIASVEAVFDWRAYIKGMNGEKKEEGKEE